MKVWSTVLNSEIGGHLERWLPLTPFPRDDFGRLSVYYAGDYALTHRSEKNSVAIIVTLSPKIS